MQGNYGGVSHQTYQGYSWLRRYGGGFEWGCRYFGGGMEGKFDITMIIVVVFFDTKKF